MRIVPSTSQNSSEEFSWCLIRLVRPTGIRKNSTMANATASTTVPIQTAFGISSGSSPPFSSGGSCALAETSRARKPIAIEPPRATMPRMMGSRRTRWRRMTDSSGWELTSISPRAASSGESSPCSSCSALGLRTATAQLETPRIITPSSTA